MQPIFSLTNVINRPIDPSIKKNDGFITISWINSDRISGRLAAYMLGYRLSKGQPAIQLPGTEARLVDEFKLEILNSKGARLPMFNIDGEALDARSVHVKVLPQQLTIFRPAVYDDVRRDDLKFKIKRFVAVMAAFISTTREVLEEIIEL